MELFQSFRCHQNIDILGVADVAVVPEGQRPDDRERNALLGQPTAQGFEGAGNVTCVHVISPELLNERSEDRTSHGVIVLDAVMIWQIKN